MYLPKTCRNLYKHHETTQLQGYVGDFLTLTIFIEVVDIIP